MHTIANILMVFCSLCVAKGADDLITNNATIVVDTNVACSISIDEHSGWDVGPPPVCFVRLNNSSSLAVWGLRLSAEKLFAIDLVDAKGHSVGKTEYGKQFDQPLTQKEIRDWFMPMRRYISRAWLIVPFDIINQHWEDVGQFSILRAFKLTKIGEYTLHLRMRLMQTGISDSLGTIRTNILDRPYLAPETKSIYFQAVWLPEVVARVQIRPEDIPQTDSNSSSQTNALSK